MKVLYVDCEYCQYPEGINSPAEFAEYLDGNFNRFIEVKCYSLEHCNAPYLIEEEVITKYFNVSQIDSFYEEDVTVLPREEYDRRLKNLMAVKCADCVHHDDEDSFDDVRDTLSLDGQCWRFEKKPKE